MKPPVCALCGRAFDPRSGGGTVGFADYEPLPAGMTGHPRGCLWFCRRHLAPARRLGGATAGAALARLRRRHWLAALRGRLRRG